MKVYTYSRMTGLTKELPRGLVPPMLFLPDKSSEQQTQPGPVLNTEPWWWTQSPGASPD